MFSHVGVVFEGRGRRRGERRRREARGKRRERRERDGAGQRVRLDVGPMVRCGDAAKKDADTLSCCSVVGLSATDYKIPRSSSDKNPEEFRNAFRNPQRRERSQPLLIIS